jgi:ketosteroid isomerase-like protein
MRKKFTRIGTPAVLALVLGFAASLSGCARPLPQSSSNVAVDLSNPDVAAIVQIAKDFSVAFDTGDVKRLSEFYSSDLIYMPQGAPNQGLATVDEGRREVFTAYNAHVDVHIEEVKIMGDMGFDRGRFTVALTPKDGKPPTVIKGRIFEVVRKEGGKWKSFRVMTNTEE